MSIHLVVSSGCICNAVPSPEFTPAPVPYAYAPVASPPAPLALSPGLDVPFTSGPVSSPVASTVCAHTCCPAHLACHLANFCICEIIMCKSFFLSCSAGYHCSLGTDGNASRRCVFAERWVKDCFAIMEGGCNDNGYQHGCGHHVVRKVVILKFAIRVVSHFLSIGPAIHI